MFIELIVAVFVGITSSYHSCSYGWAEQYNNRVFVKGDEKNGYGGGYDGGDWEPGDETYNPTDHTLSMYLKRTNKTYNIDVDISLQAYVHADFLLERH